MADRFSDLLRQPGSSDFGHTHDNAHRVHPDTWLRPLLITSGPDDMTPISEWPIESEWRDPVHLRVT